MRLEAPARRSRLSLTPVIDVVFLLLLFFMLASTFGRFAEVELSFAGAQDSDASAPAVLLIVEPGGIYRVGDDRVRPDELPAALERGLPGAEGRVLVRPDEAATAQEIVTAIERARAADVGPVILAR